ncbi:MAG: DUF2786 domain-containing protein [Candidatus Tenebribacter davisii]|nr:DUF2786 domain-containing protein [Candidatus Tenebribacter davisii]
MNEDKQKIIDKISKILCQAKDQEGTPEGDTFKRHAAMLMAKYRIQETEVDLETDNFIADTFKFYKDGTKRPQWVSSVVSTFCATFDTKVIFRKFYDYTEWEVIGTFSDVETTLYFIDVVTAHIEKEAWKFFPQKTYSGKRNQFGNVAASIIWERAWELKSQMDETIHAQEGCTALVVVKEKEIQEAMEEMYPNLRAGRRSKTDMPSDKKTWDAGKAAGKSAPLNFAIGDAA